MVPLFRLYLLASYLFQQSSPKLQLKSTEKMSSKLILYFSSESPPARACLLLARYLSLDIELRHIDIDCQESHDNFVKAYPIKKVPVLVDGEFVLIEARAILAYLVNSRTPGSDLYPSDPQLRAIVDQRLYYDSSIAFEKLANFVVRFLFLL